MTISSQKCMLEFMEQKLPNTTGMNMSSGILALVSCGVLQMVGLNKQQ